MLYRRPICYRRVLRAIRRSYAGQRTKLRCNRQFAFDSSCISLRWPVQHNMNDVIMTTATMIIIVTVITAVTPGTWCVRVRQLLIATKQ